jgi:pyridoxine 4-dehydrogenase
MKAALESGSNFWNGGEFYGPPNANSLHLLYDYFKMYPEDSDKVVLSIKGGALPGTFTPTGDKAGLIRSIKECLKILDGTKKIDIFECGRVDPKVPIEETVGYLAEFVAAGKIGGIGLSEVSAATIRRAAAVHPIAAVEVEFSLFSTDIQTNGVAATCAELDIPIVAYSPLGRGFLTGQIKSFSDVTEFQKMGPRFHEENFHKNLELVETIKKVAERKGCTSAQLAIGWVTAHSGAEAGVAQPIIIPLPGATTVSRVQENMKDVQLTTEDMKEIDEILVTMPVQGPRVPKFLEHLAWA